MCFDKVMLHMNRADCQKHLACLIYTLQPRQPKPPIPTPPPQTDLRESSKQSFIDFLNPHCEWDCLERHDFKQNIYLGQQSDHILRVIDADAVTFCYRFIYVANICEHSCKINHLDFGGSISLKSDLILCNLWHNGQSHFHLYTIAWQKYTKTKIINVFYTEDALDFNMIFHVNLESNHNISLRNRKKVKHCRYTVLSYLAPLLCSNCKYVHV